MWNGNPLSLAQFNALLAQNVGDLTPSDLKAMQDFLARRFFNSAETLSVITGKFA